MAQPSGPLVGRKVLLVEDNYLIAEHVRGLLEDAGCDVVGPASGLARALALVHSGAAMDGALLDINLDGEFCFAAAAALSERGIPFVFVTGYDDRTIVPREFAEWPVLSKPLDERRLIETVAATFPVPARDEDT